VLDENVRIFNSLYQGYPQVKRDESDLKALLKTENNLVPDLFSKLKNSVIFFYMTADVNRERYFVLISCSFICQGTNRPGDSEWAFSVFESSCHLLFSV